MIITRLFLTDTWHGPRRFRQHSPCHNPIRGEALLLGPILCNSLSAGQLRSQTQIPPEKSPSRQVGAPHLAVLRSSLMCGNRGFWRSSVHRGWRFWTNGRQSGSNPHERKVGKPRTSSALPLQRLCLGEAVLWSYTPTGRGWFLSFPPPRATGGPGVPGRGSVDSAEYSLTACVATFSRLPFSPGGV
jgi:hypothetical protein